MNRRVFGAALTVAAASLAVALAMAARELIVAARFGTGEEADAIVVALLIPTFAINVIGGSVANSLVPAVVAARDQHGQRAAESLISGIGFCILALLAITTLVFLAGASVLLGLVGSGFDSEKLALTHSLYLVSLPTIILGGICGVWSSTLNAYGRFALAAASPAVVPLFPVAGLLLFPERGVYSIAVGLIGGYAARAVVLYWGLRRIGVSSAPKWTGSSPRLRAWAAQYAPAVVASVFMASSVLVDQAVAASLGPGSVATLGYGTRLVLLFTGLGAAALGTAVLPFFSSMSATGEWRQLRRTVWFFVVVGFGGALLVSVVLIAFAEQVVTLVFERGSFGTADTIAVARVQALAAIQLPFFAASMVLSRLVSSLGSNQWLLVQSVMVMVLTVVLDIVLAQFIGVAGIALAASLVTLSSLAYLAICSLMLMRNREYNVSRSLPAVSGDTHDVGRQ